MGYRLCNSRDHQWAFNESLTCLIWMQAYRSIQESNGEVLKIPMTETHVRSLNLAVSAGVALYEAIRQLDGPH